MNKIKLIIAGSRNAKITLDELLRIFEFHFEVQYREDQILEIVSGGAIGVDRLAEELATYYNFKKKIFIPDWDKYGKAAGPIRNEEMAKYGTDLLAIWDGKSKGTLSMINIAHRYGKEIIVCMAKGKGE